MRGSNGEHVEIHTEDLMWHDVVRKRVEQWHWHVGEISFESWVLLLDEIRDEWQLKSFDDRFVAKLKGEHWCDDLEWYWSELKKCGERKR